jgi:hypothetical protein
VASWAELEAAAPEIAREGRRLLYARGDGEAFLVTVGGDAPPRIHPINIGIVEIAGGGGAAGVARDELVAFINNSPKKADLEQDGRYAVHTHQDPAAPDEFSVRGRVRVIRDPAEWQRVGSHWFFEPQPGYLLVAFDIDAAVLGLRRADEWPPRYQHWSAKQG